MTSIGRIDYFDQLGTGVHDPATHTLEPRADSITAELAARPGTSAHMRMVLDDMDVRALLPTVRVPRLVLVLNAFLSRGLRRIALSLAMISPLAVLRRDWYSLLWPGPKTMGCFG